MPVPAAAVRRPDARWVPTRRVPARYALVWLAVLGSGAAAAEVAALMLPPAIPLGLLLLALALVCGADLAHLRLRFGHASEKFTCVEAAFVLSAVLLPLPALPLVLPGGIVAAGVLRRDSAFKVAFNAGTAAGAAGVAVLCCLALHVQPANRGVRDIAVLVVATGLYSVYSTLVVTAIVAATSGLPLGAVFRRSLGLSLLMSVGNSAGALLVVGLWLHSRPTLVLLPPALVCVFVVYRNYLSAMQDRDLWQQLDAAAKEMTQLDEEVVAQAALRRALELFGADAVELQLPERGYRREAGRVAEPSEDAVPSYATVQLGGTDARIGTLRLVFAGPVRLSVREHAVLNTFGAGVATTLVNARLHGQARSQAEQMTRLAREKVYEAAHDPLTGLPNRSLLHEQADRAVARVAFGGGCCGVLLVDLTHFKVINDTLGHAAGDRVLQAVAGRLREVVRRDDLAARVGGDEFALLLPDLPGPEVAEQIAESIRLGLSEPFAVEGMSLVLEAAIGVACCPQDAVDAERLLQRADIATRQAKQTGRPVARYARERDDTSVEQLALLGEVRTALAQDQLVAYYQPKVDLHTFAVRGLEVLVRWQHPERGLLAPGAFIPAVEQSELIGPLTERVLDMALAQYAEWAKDGPVPPLAVNLSARNLLDRSLPRTVAELLERHDVPGAALVCEITETTMMSELDVVEDVLAELRALGVRLSADDFGTGYSSLALLQRIAVHELKIDRSFVAGILDSDSDRTIVRAIIDLAHGLGVKVTGEGVETADQLRVLDELGCDLVQGYYLHRPMPSAALGELLRREREAAAAQRPALAPVIPLPAVPRPLRSAGGSL